jgi:hypothetical protein
MVSLWDMVPVPHGVLGIGRIVQQQLAFDLSELSAEEEALIARRKRVEKQCSYFVNEVHLQPCFRTRTPRALVAAGAGVTHRVHQVHRRALWAEPEISSLVAHLICKHGRLARMEQMEAKRPVRGGTRARSAHPRPLLGAPQEARASAG